MKREPFFNSMLHPLFSSMTWPWIAAYLCIAAAISFCFQLGDLVTTSFHGYQIWNCLFQGRLHEFYTVCANLGTDSAAYDPPIYLVFGLWNLPVYIVNSLFGITPNPGITTVWSRVMLMLFFFGGACVMEQILHDLRWEAPQKRLATILFMTTPVAVFPVIVLGCYDIIPVLFALLGIRQLLKGNAMTFILWFALANSFKYLTIFMFIPLVLLTEKRWFHILWKTLLGLSFTAFNIALCRCLPSTADRGSLNGHVTDQFFSFCLSIDENRVVSVCLIGFVVICLLAAAWKDATPSDILFLPLLVYGWLFLTIPFHAQWIVMMAPFSVFAFFIHPERKQPLLLAEAALFAGFTVICWTCWHIDEQLIDICSPLSFLLRLDKLYNHFSISIGHIIESVPALQGCFFALFYGGLFSFLLLGNSHGGLKKHNPGTPDMTPCERLFRAIMVLFFVLPVAVCFTLSYRMR